MNFRPKQFNGRKVAIVAGVRTPFAKAGMDLATMTSVDLGVIAVQEVLAQSGLEAGEVDQVVIGNIAQPADAANISRVIELFAGLPKSIPAVTVQRNCASGLESISIGAMDVASGQSDVVLAGGTESMSNIPVLFSEGLKDVFFRFAFAKTLGQKLQALSRFKGAYLKPVIGLEEGLRDPVSGFNMGETAENLAKDFHITREEQDAFALRSHQRAIAAREKMKEEIVPVYIAPKFKKALDVDVGPRDGQTLEQLAKLRPYFDRRHGTVTTGNACPITDGAAMVMLMAEDLARAQGRKILGRIHSIEFAGCDPSRMGLGPVFAIPKAAANAGLSMKDIDLFEINEAFAAQVIACQRAFASKMFCEQNLGKTEAIGEIPDEKLNVNGGAIALGHPVGTTGTRLVITLLKELKRRGQQFGMASMCIGGGQGGACVIENVA